MRKFVLLIPLIYLVPQIMKGNETMGVYLAEPIADTIAVTFTAILFAVQFKKTIKGYRESIGRGCIYDKKRSAKTVFIRAKIRNAAGL